MYGHPNVGMGPESIGCLDALINAIKRRQVMGAGKLELLLPASRWTVGFTNGYLEVDGEVPDRRAQRELDATLARAFASGGVQLKEVGKCRPN